MPQRRSNAKGHADYYLVELVRKGFFVTGTLSKPEESEVPEFQAEKMASAKAPCRSPLAKRRPGEPVWCGCTGASQGQRRESRRGTGTEDLSLRGPFSASGHLV